MNNHIERGLELPENREKEGPRQVFLITRHVERTPAGDLTPDGLAVASKKGEAIEAEVLKGYSSTEPTDRAYKTLEQMSQSSGITSARLEQSDREEKHYKTRRREGLAYNITGPLEARIKAKSQMIDAAVKRDYSDYDPKDKSQGEKWAPIRAKYQPIGLREALVDEQIRHIFAMGLAAQFESNTEISNEYVKKRQSALERKEVDAKPIEKDVILNTGTHGGFTEALMSKALVRKGSDNKEKRGFDISRDEKGDVQFEKAMGDIILPGESIKTGYPVGEETPDMLPVEFEQGRFQGEECYLDTQKIKLLAEQFKIYQDKLKKWQKEKTKENEDELVATVDQLEKEFGV